MYLYHIELVVEGGAIRYFLFFFGILTLARKFDTVHKNTVTSKRLIPNVLLAIFHILGFGCKVGMLPQELDKRPTFSEGVGGSESLRLGASYPASLSLADINSCDAMVSDKRSTRTRN